MKKLAAATALALLIVAPAFAQDSAKIMTSLPADATTITNVYKQNVYDPQQNKIGDVEDLLVTKDGQIAAAIVGVGGFLGAGQKDVAVPFSAIRNVQKDNKWYLTMNTTKDALKNAPGWKYDRTNTKWVPDSPGTTGTNTK
jgi:sporulation protein YlmC with PRC-barrel domain